MSRSLISVFTPSNTPPEVLARIFVQRHRLLEKLVERLKRSMLTGNMHHALLIGPRGSGKTNMVALTQHRLQQQEELDDVMRIAWLGEDDTITGLIDLAMGIADRLAEEYPDEFETDYRSPFRMLPADDAAEAILNEIHRRLQHRNLLVMFENMDAAFKGLGDHGQKRWRAFLQEKGRIATLATSQQIFDGVSDRDLPFWGFFDIHHLAPLSFDDSRTLIRNISIENKNKELVQFIDTAEGRYRIRSLHHLAGGNHRMYVLLSEFLTKASLDDLVSAFETLADELTPYFQERIRSLPAQQAKIVQSLAAMEGAAITVKEIAASTFIDERSCSKQLGELRSKRYVQAEKRGKESYYELSEPLMRLCLEVKNQRGKPLKLIARFLKAWFTADDLKSQLSKNLGSSNRADAYCVAALELDGEFQKAVYGQINRDIETQLQKKNFAAALSLAEELQCADQVRGRLQAAKVKFESGDAIGSIEDLTVLIEMRNCNVEVKALSLLNRGATYGRLGETEKELADYTALIEMSNAPVDLKATVLVNRGVTYRQLGETEKGLADFTALIEMPDAPVEQKAKVLFNRGITYRQLGETQKGLADFTALIEMPDAPAEMRARAMSYIGSLYWENGKMRESLATYQEAMLLAPRGSEVHCNVMFDLPEPLLEVGTLEEVASSLRKAFQENEPTISSYGGTPKDLFGMVLRGGSSDWERYVATLLPIYVEFGATEKLGSGLTQLIEKLDQGDYSHNQLDLWNSLWHELGVNIEALEIPLSCLSAAIAAIKTKSDRPLFVLPIEVRSLVRSLLNKSLGNVA